MKIRTPGLILTVLIVMVFAALLAACGSSPQSPSPSPSPTSTTEGTLQVIVEDTAGAPLSGAKVVSQSQPEGQLNVNGLTAENGMVTFKGIKAGKYQFLISRADYEPQFAEVTVIGADTIAITINLNRSATPAPGTSSSPNA